VVVPALETIRRVRDASGDRALRNRNIASLAIIHNANVNREWLRGPLAGPDHAITPKLIARLKYRYYDFTTYGSLTAGGGATTGSRANAKASCKRCQLVWR
jgi:hypothetical protein